MSAAYDLYQPGDSWLHRLDSRVKLLGALLLSLLVLSWQTVWLMLAALALAHLALASARIPRERLTWVWRMMLPPMTLIAILWVLLYPGEGQVLVALWRVRITADSLAQGTAIALRLATLSFWLFAWLFATDQATLVQSLVALGLPHAWGLALVMALRHLPTMAGHLRLIRDAQQARGLELERGNLFQRARAHLPIIVPLIITSLRTAENLARALEARAYSANTPRSHWRTLRFRLSDAVCLGLLLAASAALLYARHAHGLGAHPLRLWP